MVTGKIMKFILRRHVLFESQYPDLKTDNPPRQHTGSVPEKATQSDVDLNVAPRGFTLNTL